MQTMRQFLRNSIERAKEKKRAQLLRAEQDRRAILMANLRGNDPQLIANAARELGVLACAEAVGPLIQVMHEEIRRRAFASRSGGNFSMEKLQRDPAAIRFSPYEWLLNCQVLEMAEHALIRIGAPAVPALIRALEDPAPRGRELRQEVAWVLGKLKAAEAVRPLAAALTRGDEDLADRARAALQTIGSLEAEKALANPPLDAGSPEAAAAPAPDRAGALELGAFDGPYTGPPICDLTQSDVLRQLQAHGMTAEEADCRVQVALVITSTMDPGQIRAIHDSRDPITVKDLALKWAAHCIHHGARPQIL